MIFETAYSEVEPTQPVETNNMYVEYKPVSTSSTEKPVPSKYVQNHIDNIDDNGSSNEIQDIDSEPLSLMDKISIIARDMIT